MKNNQIRINDDQLEKILYALNFYIVEHRKYIDKDELNKFELIANKLTGIKIKREFDL